MSDRIMQIITPDGIMEFEMAEEETPEEAVERALLAIQIEHPEARVTFIEGPDEGEDI